MSVIMSFCFPYPYLPILTLRSPQAVLNCSLGVTKHYKDQAIGRYAFVLQLRIIDVTRFTDVNEARVKKVNPSSIDASGPLCFLASAPRRKIPPYPFSRRLGGPHCRPWRFVERKSCYFSRK